MNGWIGVDLDGTLAFYDHWRGIDHIGDPIPAMITRIRTWLAEGKVVKIFTARVSTADEEEKRAVIQHIHAWLQRHGLPPLEVTNVKDFGMIELWDDRAMQVIPNSGIAVAEEVARLIVRCLNGTIEGGRFVDGRFVPA